MSDWNKLKAAYFRPLYDFFVGFIHRANYYVSLKGDAEELEIINFTLEKLEREKSILCGQITQLKIDRFAISHRLHQNAAAEIFAKKQRAK